MALVLEVISAHASSMGANARRVVGDRELKIGRESDNDWIFPQNYVSRHQAVIRCVNGMYFLEQTGSCPITVNEASRPLERNHITRLATGDRFQIDDIQIRVLETDAPAEPSVAPQPWVAPPAPPTPLGPDGVPKFSSVPGPSFGSASVDPLRILGISPPGGGDAANPKAGPSIPDLKSILDGALPVSPRANTDATPPPAPPAALADDWFQKATPGPSSPVIAPLEPPRPDMAALADIQPPSRPTPIEQGNTASVRVLPSEPPPPAGAADWVDDLLRGVGLDPRQVQMSPEVVRQLGRVLRIVVEGTRQVLQARKEIRREFRTPSTELAQTDNNPLKFSADAADALHKLLVQRSPAYLDTVSAFSDAFDDIRAHQLAMLESLRTAFEHMLRQFDPQTLEKQLAGQAAQGGVLGLGGRPKLWEAYVARFRDWQSDRDEAFRRLFGEEFGKAYEQNLARLKQTMKADNGDR
jgi:type VI secretion system protein ImpI